jgi:hypothetical protein
LKEKFLWVKKLCCSERYLEFNKSKLLNTKYIDLLKNWGIKGYGKNWKRIYKFKNGLDKFHEFCDNKTPTLVIIQSDKGNIFGGFTTENWVSESNSHWVYSGVTWIFLLKGIKKKFKLKK